MIAEGSMGPGICQGTRYIYLVLVVCRQITPLSRVCPGQECMGLKSPGSVASAGL